MQYSERHVYEIENGEIDVGRECLIIAGQERHLRPKAFQVLVYLVERHDRLVTRDELFDAIWTDTAVTNDVLVQCVKEIRRALEDDPQKPRFIKTVPKSGYRFIGETTSPTAAATFTEEITRVEFELEDEIDIPRWETSSFAQRPRRLRPIAIAAAGLSVFVIATFAYLALPPAASEAEIRLPQIAGRRAVAVTFFENASKDRELEWLRGGLADMLITDLSRSEHLTVLSRQQLATVMERIGHRHEETLDFAATLDLARKTAAEVIISGSFARLGETVRIDVQVHDAVSGGLITADSLTAVRPSDILAQIDILSLKLSRHLGPAEAVEPPGLSSVMTGDLEAYRYYSLGVAKANALENKEAVELLEKAIARDPQFAMAHARLGYTHAVIAAEIEQGKPHLERAFELSDRTTDNDRTHIAAWYAIANFDFAAAIDAYRAIIRRSPLESEAYWRLGRLLVGEERSDEAIEVLNRGIAVDPGAKNLFNTLGTVLSTMGRHQEAIAAHERYVALAPNEPNAYDSLGLSHQWAGNYDEAVSSFTRALEINPAFNVARIHLAQSRSRSGQYVDALRSMREYDLRAVSPRERARGHEVMAYIHLKRGDLAAAEESSRRASSLTKAASWAGYLVAVRKGQQDRARQIAEDLVRSWVAVDRGARGNMRFLAYYKAAIALNEGQNERAVEQFREALRHRPPTWNYDDFEDGLATALLQLGRYDEAIAEFERILQLSPRYPLAKYSLARAYDAKGLNDEARSLYRAFLEDWKDADHDVPEVVAARRALK